jgi:hypothetical protein
MGARTVTGKIQVFACAVAASMVLTTATYAEPGGVQ